MRAISRSHSHRPAVMPTMPPRSLAPQRPLLSIMRPSPPVSRIALPLQTAFILPRLSRCFATSVAVPSLPEVSTPQVNPGAETSKRRKRIYKRMKPSTPDQEIANTIKALRQKARLSPRWISHVLQQCGVRVVDIRARIKQASEIFDAFSNLSQQHNEPVPLIVYSAAIGALVKTLARRPTDAPEVLPMVENYLLKMRNAKHELPLQTLTSLVRLYGLARKPEKAIEIAQSVEERGLQTDVQWHNTLIEMYYLNAAPEKAKAVHEKLLASQDAQSNTVTYNLMMKIAAQRNDYRQVMEFFDDMKNRGIPVDQFSYLEVIRAAGRLGDPNTAQRHFDDMRAAGIKQEIYVWTALVDAYCRANTIRKAFDIADEMRAQGVPADSVIWRIIRDAAHRSGKADMWTKLRPSWVANLAPASVDRQRTPRKDRNRRKKKVNEQAEEGSDEGSEGRGDERGDGDDEEEDYDRKRSSSRERGTKEERGDRGNRGARGERHERREGRGERSRRGNERGGREERSERAERRGLSEERGRREERGGRREHRAASPRGNQRSRRRN